MELTVADELRRTFHLAALRREAGILQTGRQWKAAKDIRVRCDEARKQENRLYAARYDTRVEMARRRLIDEAASRPLDLKPRWAGDDRFAPDATLRQARREVHAGHEGRMRRIDEFESRQLSVLIESAMRENNLQGVAREAFARAAERRSGHERRSSRQRER